MNTSLILIHRPRKPHTLPGRGVFAFLGSVNTYPKYTRFRRAFVLMKVAIYFIAGKKRPLEPFFFLSLRVLKCSSNKLAALRAALRRQGARAGAPHRRE